MPSAIILCVVRGKTGRLARSNLTQLCTSEREEKVRLPLRIRYKKKLNHSLLNEHVHKLCYKVLVYDQC
ncbi:unnamed protein product [Adineta steineri]|uniref:Uncharacterized protein n=1 Tax=Adineta steineri TaxID=433720 RepID=A0A813PXT0_9BILA|nr:unnamed protein product [Adineta steineri]CAF0794870.1 unnamed protein product [Adineta steineri]